MQLNLFGNTALDNFIPGLPSHSIPIPSISESQSPLRASDYRLIGERCLGRNWKIRAEDNIRAIELAIQLEHEKREVTVEDQEVLIKYTGFGASELANHLFPLPGHAYVDDWKPIHEKLISVINPEQREKLMRSTQYAHYTPEYIIHAIWKKLIQFGFNGGKILEPGCGSGLFMACMPDKYNSKTAFTAIENEPLTALIAQKLYPNSRIIQQDFLKTSLNGDFDLAIGNPPFSDRKIINAGFDVDNLSLHEGFLLKSLEALREGGICVFVISRWFMDKLEHTVRANIATKARLIGAVRLPQTSMRERAGTDVVVDVVFFQKDTKSINPHEWVESIKVDLDEQHSYPINQYFIGNPFFVLGQHATRSNKVIIK